MKHITFIKKSLSLTAIALACVLSGCIKDDLAECSKLTVKVENGSGDDISALGMVGEATLYIFDANKKLLETREIDKSFITSKKEITFDGYADNTKLYIVAWGNEKGEKQTITKSQTLDDLILKVNKKSSEFAMSPDSLYYGSREVTTFGNGIAGGNSELPIRLKVGTYTIRTFGLQSSLKSFGLKSAESLDIFIDQTLDSYNAQGVQTGDSTNYNPEGGLDASQEWASDGEIDDERLGGKQNIFAGKGLALTITRDGQELKTVTEAYDEKKQEYVPIEIAEAGRYDFIIEFKDGNISVRMRVSPWGVVDDNIDFGK